MRVTITVFLLLFLCSFSLYAQTPYAIKGSVIDTASKSRLANTTVCVLNAKDSTLVKFTRVTENGSFAISDLRKGKYILMVTYPAYADYVDAFHLDSLKKEVDFGRINMRLKSRILAEVLIKGEKAAIKINGDTTEFNASSYVIQPNSKVEDLLRQLPGIQIDKDGKITAQGQAVNKVLVDGEEFFGDDPTLVTKNIRGDMVDKVQLYDKKSDQATFTGIDDGIKNKTINIKLKEDKKNGYFGKVEAGAGTDDYYEGQGMYNMFKAKQKFSAYGTIANTGKVGLGWEDSNKYGTSSLQFSDDGGVSIASSRDEFDTFSGNYDGHGIPLARTGGVHYDSKWNADKESINTDYKIGYLEVDGTNSTLTQRNLPTGIQNSSSYQTYKNSSFRQKLDGVYQLKIDSLTNLKVSIDGTIKHSQTNNNTTASSYRDFDTLLNKSDKTLTYNTDQKILNASVFYNKKFKKVGRSFSWNISEAYNENQSHGYLNSNINFYNYQSGGLDSTQVIDQYKTNHNISSNLTSNITYSEPITKRLAIIFNYGTGFNNSTADRQSFDRSIPNGPYDLLDATLSNDYQFNQFSNQLGANFNYKKNKTILNFGTRATDVKFDQVDQYTGNTLKRSFLNWSPQANYQYKFSPQQSFSFYYSGSTTQPTINQIQPVVNNNDPLNISIGNPDLKPSFRNSFNAYYNSYKVISGQSVYVGGSFSVISNPIVGNTVTDTTGKTTNQSSNLSSKSPINFSFYGNFYQKIKGIDVNIGANANVSGSTSYNYSNHVLNVTQTDNYSAQLSISKYKEKKYDFYLGFGPRYTVSQSSLQPNINGNGYGLNGYERINLYLPAKFEIGTDGDYQYSGPTESFKQDYSRLNMNASVAKKFLKDDNLKFALSVNDIFNQNIGFSRNASGSTITQSNYTSIRRYFMFSITYDFSKMGAGAVKQ
jgi:outer membrane receptor protein involved in Fe transport